MQFDSKPLSTVQDSFSSVHLHRVPFELFEPRGSENATVGVVRMVLLANVISPG